MTLIPETGFRLRGRQQEWLDKIKEDFATRSRLLIVAPGGIGKTTIFAALAAQMWNEHGLRTLVLENRDRLTEQTADRLRKETGLEVDVEKGKDRASPFAPIVVGCVQSISKASRLTGFTDTHFGLIVIDECHLCLNPSWLRVIHYFHYGAESLAEDWKKPADGAYQVKALLAGFTASPDLGNSKNLGDLFQGPKPCINYSYLEAIEEGWLVGIQETNIPVKIDTRKFRRRQTEEGAAFNIEDQNAAIIPIIQELAKQILEYGADRKGICFVPSVEIARLMHEAVSAMGIRSWFASGECIDKNEKTDEFAACKKGWIFNACLYNYGVDFPDCNCVAIFGPMISKVKYIQSIYRGTRVLPGILKDGMTVEERLAAIAASDKPYLPVLSPYFMSDKINICAVYDMFGVPPPDKKVKPPKDYTEPAKIRDYIAALEKAADKHSNRQPRTIDPVAFSLSVGNDRIKCYTPETSADMGPPTKEELDVILAANLDSSAIKNSGQAQLVINTLRERERLGRASPNQVRQLMLAGFSEEKASLMSKKQAGAIMAKRAAQGWKRC